MPTPKIIIADDEPFVRNFLKNLIDLMNFELIDEVTNGKDLIDSMMTHKPNILLLDLCMPDINGIVFLKEFSHMFPKTCIIVLTATQLPDLKEIDAMKNIHCFINKDTPIDLMEKGIKDAWKWFKQNNDL